MSVTVKIKNNLYCLDKKCVCGHLGGAHTNKTLPYGKQVVLACTSCRSIDAYHPFQLNNLDLLAKKYEEKHR